MLYSRLIRAANLNGSFYAQARADVTITIRVVGVVLLVTLATGAGGGRKSPVPALYTPL